VLQIFGGRIAGRIGLLRRLIRVLLISYAGWHNEPAGIEGPDGGEGRKVGDGSTGIVVCDWVGNNEDWDLVRCVVGMNSKLEFRE